MFWLLLTVLLWTNFLWADDDGSLVPFTNKKKPRRKTSYNYGPDRCLASANEWWVRFFTANMDRKGQFIFWLDQIRVVCLWKLFRLGIFALGNYERCEPGDLIVSRLVKRVSVQFPPQPITFITPFYDNFRQPNSVNALMHIACIKKANGLEIHNLRLRSKPFRAKQVIRKFITDRIFVSSF